MHQCKATGTAAARPAPGCPCPETLPVHSLCPKTVAARPVSPRSAHGVPAQRSGTRSRPLQPRARTPTRRFLHMKGALAFRGGR